MTLEYNPVECWHMTKTFNLKYSATGGINGDGVSLCNSVTVELFPQLANGGKVTVSTTRQHRKGEMKFEILHDGERVPFLVIDNQEHQITTSTYWTLRRSLKFNEKLTHLFVKIH